MTRIRHLATWYDRRIVQNPATADILGAVIDAGLGAATLAFPVEDRLARAGLALAQALAERTGLVRSCQYWSPR